MAKKVKRKVSQVAAQPESAPQAAEPAAAAVSRPGYSRRTTTAAEFNPDYSYVIKDLKRIGLLAGSFFVILIALSFIIR